MRPEPAYLLLVAALSTLATTPPAETGSIDVTSYTLMAKGDNVGVVLQQENGESNGYVSSPRHGNFTDAVAAFFARKKLDPGPRTLHSISMLLELANGGDCDACKTFVEEAVLRLAEVQDAKTAEAMEDARARGIDFKDLTGMSMDKDFVQREFGNLCTSERYRRYALHIQAGCNEHLVTRNFLQFLHAAANSTTAPERRIPEFKRLLCQVGRVQSPEDGILEDAPPPCPVRSASPAKSEWSPCRMCGESVMDLIYLLRRTHRGGIPAGGDPMSLNKPKSGRSSAYLGDRHVRMTVQDLCSDVSKRHSGSVATDLQEHCEDLVSDYEENLRSLAREGQWLTPSPGQVICVDVAGSCTRPEYDDIEPHLESFHYRERNETRKLPQHAINLNRDFQKALAKDEEMFHQRQAEGHDSLANRTVLQGGPEGRAFGVNYKNCNGLGKGSEEMIACIKRTDDETIRGIRDRSSGDVIPGRAETEL